MADNKKPEPEVEFSATKAADTKRSSRNVKIAIIGVITVILLLGAVVSVAVYFTLSRKATSNRALGRSQSGRGRNVDVSRGSRYTDTRG